MKTALRRFRALPVLIFTPFLLLAAAFALALTDLAWMITRRRGPRKAQGPPDAAPDSRGTTRSAGLEEKRPDVRAASLVIPNWNGKDLLERFLPSWLQAIAGHPGSEIVIVDNGSTDGSADWIRANFPQVNLLALKANLGFGAGSNAGFQAAKNDIVVLLNSDMRVEADFLAPLLSGFADEDVFAVSCQIFLGDKTKRREETGLTQGWWRDGGLRVTHREDPLVDTLFPCLYGGGGSCAFDRAKFLSLGGFDELLAPFYLEDTDIGYLAWKRGWKVLYQPASVVHHEHRGTIGKKFSPEFIQGVLEKNYVLFAWKNIHAWRLLADHFLFGFAGALMTAWAGPAPGRASTRGLLRAVRQLPRALRSRWNARGLSVIDDAETFRRTQPAYFRDRFSRLPVAPARPRVLFVAPYSVFPPVHGGGVFMYNTLLQLSRWCDVHAIVMLDYESEREGNSELLKFCRSLETLVRTNDKDPHLASITPHAVHEFRKPEVEWLLQRETLRHGIDVIQLEYTSLGQYARPFRQLVCALFEHDVYFQSIGRALPFMSSPLDRFKASFEYLRAIRFELNLLPRCDHIQVCTAENKEYLRSFLPRLAGRIDAGMRAGINAAAYPYPGGPRRPYTMLFLGSFRHIPNQTAIDWFTRLVLPLIVGKLPQAKLLVAGSDPPPRHAFPDPMNAIELLGFVEDVQPLFSSCAVFVCPVRSGSGVRVKLLEAFASGMPVVSTTLGAEGLASEDGGVCALADHPAVFAEKVIELLTNPERAAEIASRARREVEANWDMAVITRRLAEKYGELLRAKRGAQE